MLQVGSLVDNKYKILSEVGHGGMSVVYLAINERANKTWAVKEVRKDGVVDFESVKQGLVVETDMLKKLSHPYLPSIIDVIDTDDSFLIVMDYIEGASLQKLLRTEGAQSEARVVKWGKQLCDVLGYLHRQNPPIIYRDMKPANVMLKPDGNVTLIDFGTAREFKNRAMVEDTTCLGTRGYAAPEQFGGRGQTDARTDIYCLGATLYHLLTGHSPAEPPYEIKPLSYWIPQYAGSGLEKLILKCTQQDPSTRYQSCEELMYALEHYKDEDDLKQKERKRKWRVFLTAAIVGLVGLMGVIGFKLAWNNALNNSYDEKVKIALAAESIDEFVPLIKEALKIDAGKGKAYKAVLSKVKGDIDANGKLTKDTADKLNDILSDHSSSAAMNQDVLKKNDPDTYADVMFFAGIWDFFMRTDGDFRKHASEKYLSNINNEEFLEYIKTQEEDETLKTENEKVETLKVPSGAEKLVPHLAEIGQYVGSLGRATSVLGISDASYRDLFDSLTKIVSEDLEVNESNSGNNMDFYYIKIYAQVAAWINDDIGNFVRNGVSTAELSATLDSIDNGLKGLNIQNGNDLYERYAEAFRAVDAARNILASYEENSEGSK